MAELLQIVVEERMPCLSAIILLPSHVYSSLSLSYNDDNTKRYKTFIIIIIIIIICRTGYETKGYIASEAARSSQWSFSNQHICDHKNKILCAEDKR